MAWCCVHVAPHAHPFECITKHTRTDTATGADRVKWGNVRSNPTRPCSQCSNRNIFSVALSRFSAHFVHMRPATCTVSNPCIVGSQGVDDRVIQVTVHPLTSTSLEGLGRLDSPVRRTMWWRDACSLALPGGKPGNNSLS